MATPAEYHLFIIWEKARSQEKRILADITENFDTILKFEITWSQANFSENLSRFYGTNLPPGSGKEEHCGTGPFLLLIVQDKTPAYDYHETSKGQALVNSNTFLAKLRHRDWTGGGHRIHATNNPKEFDHDLALLMGTTIDELTQKYSSDKTVKLNQDIAGTGGWKNLSEMFKILNLTESYLVMRNYDPLPDKYYAETHGDIDLLVDDYLQTQYVINAEAVFPEPHRVHNRTKIGGQEVLFDLRYIGDGYYDTAWQNAMMVNKVLHKGFYVMAPKDHFYSLLHHALIHKPEVAEDYIAKLNELNKELKITKNDIDSSWFTSKQAHRALGKFLAKSHYGIPVPEPSVYFNTENARAVRATMWRTRPVSLSVNKAVRVLRHK